MKRRAFLLFGALAPIAPLARLLPAAPPAACNLEAIAYFDWAEASGARLYALQQTRHQAQLDAITGGMDVDRFIAQRQAEAVRLLGQIDVMIEQWCAP